MIKHHAKQGERFPLQQLPFSWYYQQSSIRNINYENNASRLATTQNVVWHVIYYHITSQSYTQFCPLQALFRSSSTVLVCKSRYALYKNVCRQLISTTARLGNGMAKVLAHL